MAVTLQELLDHRLSEVITILSGELGTGEVVEDTGPGRFLCEADRLLPTLHNRVCNDASLLQPDQADYLLIAFSPTKRYTGSIQTLIDGITHLISFLGTIASAQVHMITETGEALVCLRSSGRSLSAIAYDLHIHLTFISEQEAVHLYAGMDRFQEIGEIGVALRHARDCVELLHDIGAARGVCAYEYYNFIRLFGGLKQDGGSFVLENDALQQLLERDRTGGSGLVLTLRIYLSENCNTTRTAERLFIHRHTLINRIRTIEELCGIDLDDYYTRLYMEIALMMHDFFAA